MRNCLKRTETVQAKTSRGGFGEPDEEVLESFLGIVATIVKSSFVFEQVAAPSCLSLRSCSVVLRTPVQLFRAVAQTYAIRLYR